MIYFIRKSFYFEERIMRIDEILKSGKISLSFEVFPPKTDSSF